MEKSSEKEIVYRTARIAYIPNYFLVGLLALLFYFIWTVFNLSFTLIPTSLSEFTGTIIVFSFLILITFLIEEPVIERTLRRYIITNNEIMKIEGILTKKTTIIPYQSVADIRVTKGVIGRIFNYGDVHVRGVKEGGDIRMKGMKNPEEVQRIIQDKVNLVRGAIISRAEFRGK